MSRTLLPALALGALCACSGNWSNQDLEFAAALPAKADLQSKLPNGSTPSPLEGASTRKDGLAVGDASQAYAETHKASTDFNALLDGILAVVEYVRVLPPSRREDDLRVWGPYPDEKNAGYEVQVVIARVDPQHFAWAIQFHKRGDPAEFFSVVEGNYAASGGLRKGQGAVAVHISPYRAQLPSLGQLGPLSRIDMGYITDRWPKAVDMAFTFEPGNTSGLSRVGYAYRELQDRSGAMAFQLRGTDPNITALDLAAVWDSTGAGRTGAVVREGAYAGAGAVECWDARFKVVYAKQAWPGGVEVGPGESACIASPF